MSKNNRCTLLFLMPDCSLKYKEKPPIEKVLEKLNIFSPIYL